MKLSKIQKAIIALVIANIIWGAASPIFKWSLENIHPFTLAYLRFLLASIMIFPFAIPYLKIAKNDFIKVMLLSIVGITFHISLFLFGLKYTASINAPIIASAAPIFVIFISIPILKERLSLKKVSGAFLGLIGVSFLFLKPIVENGLDGNAIGNILLITATLASVYYIIGTKEIMKKYNALTITFYSFLVGTVGFLPFFLFEVSKYGFLVDLNIQGVTGIIFGSLFSSLIGYLLFYWALEKLAASDVSLFIYIDPIVAIMIAVPLLGEIPTVSYLIGAFLVFAGIYIAEGKIPYHHYKLHFNKAKEEAPYN